MTPLAFDHVSLTHFKNYSASQFSFGSKFNLISGLNGVGKTNLLDAIYYLATGKSYFTPYDQRVVAQGSSFFRITATLRRAERSHSLVFKVVPGELKEIILDQLPVARISDHIGFIPIVFSAPRDIELVTGASMARRRYLDHLLCQVDRDYLHALVTYNSLLQQRNAALKSTMADLRRVLQTYDEQLFPLAQYIFEKRKWLQASLTPRLQHYYRILAEDRETVDCVYESQLLAYGYDVLVDKYADMDLHTQRSNCGIHKDDFALQVKSMPAREFGSQGQIKSLIFALHLSKHQILADHTGLVPIMVLDDIFDKLDERRMGNLLSILRSDSFGQIFISDTSRERLTAHLPAEAVNSIHLETK